MYIILVRTLVHVKDADEREELSVDGKRSGREVELCEGGQRERLEQAVPERVERVGPGDAKPYLDGVMFVVRVHEPVVHQEVGVGPHPVEYVHLFVSSVVAVRVAHAHIARLDEIGRQLYRVNATCGKYVILLYHCQGIYNFY